MAQASAWFVNNDMTVSLSGLQSSTNTSAYISGSTNVSCHIWKALTTASTSNRLTTAAVNLPSISTSAGNYRGVFQSTAYSAITSTVRGMAVITVSHSGLDGEWRVKLRGEFRGST